MIHSFQGPTRWLSNFKSVRITMGDGIAYPSTEHAYQAQKTLDMGERQRIADLYTPRDARKAGQTVDLRPDWEAVKLDVMLEAARRKFEQPHFRRRLIATGGAELIEGNTWGDTFWGVCNGVGENHLGRILMKVRAELLDVAPTEDSVPSFTVQFDSDTKDLDIAFEYIEHGEALLSALPRFDHVEKQPYTPVIAANVRSATHKFLVGEVLDGRLGRLGTGGWVYRGSL